MSTSAPQTPAEAALLRPLIPADALKTSLAAHAKAEECDKRYLAANRELRAACAAATAAAQERNRLRKRYQTLLSEACDASNAQVEADAAAWQAARAAQAAKGGDV